MFITVTIRTENTMKLFYKAANNSLVDQTGLTRNFSICKNNS